MFRTAKHVAASAVMAAAATAVTLPAVAQEVKIAANPSSSKCIAEHGNTDRAIGCAAERFIERMNAETEAARQRGAEADRRAACSQFLMDGVKEQRFTKEQVIAAYGGMVTKDIINAKGCDVARSFGFGKRASLDAPSVK